MKRVHFSIDDVIKTLRWCNQNHPASIFDMNFWGKLKKYHEKYGIKVTCYCFENNGYDFHISQLEQRYIDELNYNRNWIRFEYHGIRDCEECCNIYKFKKEYNAVHQKLGISCGTDFVRLHCWKGSKEILTFCQEKGIHKFLCPEPDAKCETFYDLTDSECREVMCMGLWEKEERTYIQTNYRLDSIQCIEQIENIFFLNEVIIFGHEWGFVKSEDILEKIFEKFSTKNYEYIF